MSKKKIPLLGGVRGGYIKANSYNLPLTKKKLNLINL
jgi:hypothetical protein